MAGRILAIKGGKLIDGVGGSALDDSVILIQDGKFIAVGNRRDVPIPPGAEVVDVSGKTVMPGFMDGHGISRIFMAISIYTLASQVCSRFKRLKMVLGLWRKSEGLNWE